jgi:hypothetical protein
LATMPTPPLGEFIETLPITVAHTKELSFPSCTNVPCTGPLALKLKPSHSLHPLDRRLRSPRHPLLPQPP